MKDPYRLLSRIGRAFNWLWTLIDRLRYRKKPCSPSTPSEKALEVCRMVIAIKHCMIFYGIHDDHSCKEVLEKYGVDSVQLLAKKAQDLAQEVLDEHK